MRRVLRSTVSDLGFGCRRPAYWLVAALALSGCGHEGKVDVKSVTEPPTVRLVPPPVRKIVRIVGQPSFIEAYERTSIYPKMTAYIEKWIVDIGDKVTKGQTLATLFVPEMVEDFGTKKAMVGLDQERIRLAGKMVDVAGADVKAAEAEVVETQSILGKYQAEVDRWDVQVKRLTLEVERQVVSPQILLESTNQRNSNVAARDAAKATIAKAEAELLSKKAALAKAEVDVAVARADLAVAQSEERRLKAWVGYLTLTAPFDGIIVVRNANTLDFVLPASGDPTALRRSPDLSPSGTAAPNLRGRPDRYRSDLRRYPRAGRQLRQDRDQGHRARPGVPRRGAAGQRHAHVLGPQRQEPHASRRDRPEEHRQPATARHVRVCERDHRTPRRPGHPDGRTRPERRSDLLLDVQRRTLRSDGDPDRSQRRRMDRGHQSPRRSVSVRGDPPRVDAHRWIGEGHPRRPVGPHRWWAGES